MSTVTQGEKTLGLLRDVHAQSVEMSRQLLFDKAHPRDLHVIALYGSMLELSSSMMLLTKDGPKTALPIVLRSFLEAFVDLINLCADPKYGYCLEVRACRDALKFLRAAATGENPYLEKIAAKPELEENIAKQEGQLAKAKEKGGEELQIKDKFERAGMLHEYVTIYAELCSYSHNTLRALRARHVNVHAKGHEVVFYRLTSLDDVEPYLGIACNLLLKATERVHEFLNNPCRDQLRNLREAVDGFIAAHEAA